MPRSRIVVRGGYMFVLLLGIMSCFEKPSAFAPTAMTPGTPRAVGCLFMGKGFNSARNKQAEMAKKMALARKLEPDNEDDSSKAQEGEEEDEHMLEDRAMFAKLLAKSQPVEKKQSFKASRTTVKSQSVLSPANTPKARASTRKRRKKRQSKGEGVEEAERLPLQEGDVASRGDFEPLVSLESGRQLGPIGAASLVPWVPPYLTNYLVVIADPRRQSGDLHQAIQYLTSNLEPSIATQVIAISSDPNEVTASWVKRAGVEDTSIRIFSDEKLHWMHSYSAVVDDERWSMSMYVFCTRGVIQQLIREVDPARASQLVEDMIQLVEE